MEAPGSGPDPGTLEQIMREVNLIRTLAQNTDNPDATLSRLKTLRRSLHRRQEQKNQNSTPNPKPSGLPNCSTSKPPTASNYNHLIFLVHGIGRHDDFIDGKDFTWDGHTRIPGGAGGRDGGNAAFRELLEAQLRSRFHSLPFQCTVASVEWHSILHTSDWACGVRGDSSGIEPSTLDDEALLEACCPDGTGVEGLRSFARESLMDVFYFVHKAKGRKIVQSVAEQLANKYEKFLADHPGFNGGVSIFSHSLGSVIIYDLLANAGTSVGGIFYPTLPFKVDCFFAAGSPAALFLVARRSGTGQALRPNCDAFFNIWSRSDPISWKLEPIFPPFSRDGLLVSSPGTRFWLKNQARPRDRKAKMLPSARGLPPGASRSDIIHWICANDRRFETDVELPPPRWVVSDTLNAFNAHGAYWFSEDCASFVLCQILAPFAASCPEVSSPHYDMLISNFTNPAIDPRSPLVKGGRVQMRSEVTGRWNSVIALVQSGQLYIFEDLPALPPRERIDLEGATVSNPLGARSGPSSGIRVTTMKTKVTHEMVAGSTVEAADWVSDMITAIADAVRDQDIEQSCQKSCQIKDEASIMNGDVDDVRHKSSRLEAEMTTSESCTVSLQLQAQNGHVSALFSLHMKPSPTLPDGDAGEEVIMNEGDNDSRNVVPSTPNVVYKADLGRRMLLAVLGGVASSGGSTSKSSTDINGTPSASKNTCRIAGSDSESQRPQIRNLGHDEKEKNDSSGDSGELDFFGASRVGEIQRKEGRAGFRPRWLALVGRQLLLYDRLPDLANAACARFSVKACLNSGSILCHEDEHILDFVPGCGRRVILRVGSMVEWLEWTNALILGGYKVCKRVSFEGEI